jgi:hypothetical protein
MFLKSSTLVFLASVSGTLSSAGAQQLKGKYCGSTNVWGSLKFASVLEFHEDENSMNAHFVMGDSVYAFDKGEGYILKADDKIILQPDNEAYNAFLASFPLGLSTESFDTTYHRDSDRLTCKINVAMFMSLTVDLSRENCRSDMKDGVYKSPDGLVEMVVKTSDSALHVSAKGDMKAVIPDPGPLDYVIEANGKLTLSREGAPITYRMEQVPGESAIALLYTYEDAPKGVVLVYADPSSAKADD